MSELPGGSGDMDDQQLLRYSRHIMLPGFNVEGQQALLDAKVLIVGLGGLGSPAALYLAAAGVGHLILADGDRVELSNLQRQIAHRESSIGLPKAESAKQAAKALNADIQVTTIAEQLLGDNLRQQVMQADIVLDASDNFSTRFAVNQACIELTTPLVSGAAIRSEGQIIVFDPRQEDSPCYRCLYKDSDDENLSCSESGVLAPLVGVIGAMQASEAIKLLVGYGETFTGRLLVLDMYSMETRILRVPKKSDCPVCAN